jgi:nucleoside-diphosphate kinase
MEERTLVLLKPDSVKRHLSGKIISRFEETGLKIVGIKMVLANEELAREHYKLDEDWARDVYNKTKAVYEKEGKEMKYQNHLEWGGIIQKGNMDFLKEGPVIAIILEGPHAIELVRKMIGHTEPRSAMPGTIRGDFASVESYPVADANSRVVRNLVHASDSVKNAEREIHLWFRPEEIYKHKTVYDLTLPDKPL